MVTRDIDATFVIDSKTDGASDLPVNPGYSSYKKYHYKTHTVENGDNLWKVSRKLNVDVETLQQWNDLEPGEPIRAGDRLSVAYITKEHIPTRSTNLINYRVFATDTLASIASKFKLHIGEIKMWNSALQHDNYVQPGQMLRIPIQPRSKPEP